ncbi:MAG TPA: type IV toxin-antitoxin system AbiEi family antitoxin domain-containing protein [Streptosporangiaceae bacterium]|nr:type IV toxin-antitoxin system AbiEi family antitoxin domain-containing protein [Streptosporangiaceae bacterium]
MSEAPATLGVMSAPIMPQTGRVAGIVTTAELTVAGFSDDRIKTLTRRGELCQVRRGVYAEGTRARDILAFADGKQLLQLAAAVALTGPGAVVSHESAAYLHSTDLLSAPEVATLTCPPRHNWHARPGIRLHVADLPAEQVITRARLPVTTPARTVVDLARTVSFRAGLVTADSALHRKLVTKAELGQVLAGCRGWPGARRAAEVIGFADGRAESPLESIARVAFADCGLPPPELQVWLGGMGEPVGRVDFYWRQYRTIAEVDGAIKYADPDRARAQLRRDSLLRDEGFEVVHFTWQQIIQTPEQVAASIWTAFRRGVRNGELRRPG